MNEDEIDARPTKKLFIDILTRDIQIKECILDLLDNSVDGFTRNKLKPRGEIHITISPEKFEIYDTCGGIDFNLLKNHVFRFGIEDFSDKASTLGVYGIGLKRSIFKLGKKFVLETDDRKKHTKVFLDDIDSWKSSKEWSLPFKLEDSKLKNNEKTYTRITMDNLHEETKKQFRDELYIKDLRDSISKMYTYFIEKSIDIFINKNKIPYFPLLVRYSDNYKPSVFRERFKDVDIEIVCFIQPSKGARETPERKGWNVFCNNRLILVDDTSTITGWTGDDNIGELPKFHSLFNDFRGIVRLSSKNPSKLPLIQQRTGLTVDNDVYKFMLKKMIENAKPLISWIYKRLREEKEMLEEIEKRSEIETRLDDGGSAKNLHIDKITISKFSPPKIAPRETNVITINYKKSKKIVTKLKNLMNVSTAREVGEITFDYYIEMEGLDNE